MGLSNADLTSIRATAGEFLETDVTISRKTVVSDGAGGTSRTWDDVSGVKGRLEYVSGDEAILGGRDSDRIEALVKLPVGTDVTTSDRLLIGGSIYEVFSVEQAFAYVIAHVSAVA